MSTTAKVRRIDEDVLAVLSEAAIEGNVLKLPPQQLERKLYERVNAMLVDLGGKWKTRVGHIFPEDPTERLDAAMLTGQVAARVDELKQCGFFPTPAILVDRMLELALIPPGALVLEPSAGRGAIADRLRAAAREVHVVELLPENRAELSAKGHTLVEEPDFLKWEPELRYDRVVMNPPFAKQQDIAHVTKAHRHLRPGGKIVAIMSPGFTFREDARSRDFRALLARCNGSYEKNPEGSFRESGTGVNTVTVILDALPVGVDVEEVGG